MPATRYEVKVPWWSDEVMYWLEDQVAVVFRSPLSLYSGDNPPSKESLIATLNLDNLGQFLKVRGLELQSFTAGDVAHPPQEQVVQSAPAQSGSGTHNELNSTTGKYLFPWPGGEGTLAIGFFNVKSVPTFHPTQDISTMKALRRSGQMQCCDNDSNTRKAVDLINGNLDRLREQANVPVVAAAPNWLGGANCYTHGCPVFPPFPVPAIDSCGLHEGRWPIQIPTLSTEISPLRDMTGKGVTVFVLDSMPDIKNDPTVIEDAANRAGARNELLQEIASQKDQAASPFIKFRYYDLPDQIREDAEDQLVTGRDIDGNLYGFLMPDHGLFVAGIIRDLACEADIEYMRVLNDFGICSVGTLIKELEDIQSRMAPPTSTSEAGDLYQKPVVLNLSLVVTPSKEDLLQVWYGVDSPDMGSSHMDMNPSPMEAPARTQDDTDMLRSHLHMVIQSLTMESGAVIVASAGNDSGWPDMPGRIGPRFPAAFPEVIAVGAIDNEGHAPTYSNYPQLSPQTNGIATYGGSIPTLPQIGADTVDAMRGVYSDTSYPTLEAKDSPPQEHHSDNPTGWAYWSGTSFATPIISAVAARVLQSQQGVWTTQEFVPGVQEAITTPEGQQKYVTGNLPLPLQPDYGNGVSMLRAYQCVDGSGIEDQTAEKAVGMKDMVTPD